IRDGHVTGVQTCALPISRPVTDRATRRLHMSSTDKIEKEIVLRAPRARVWRALADAREFGEWFKVALTGRFEPGATVRGQITYPDRKSVGEGKSEGGGGR